MIVQAALAIGAVPTGSRGRDGNQITDGKTGNALAKGRDVACHLMAENHWLFQADNTETAMIVVMEIRSADATGSQTDRDFARARLARLPVFNAQILRCMDDDCFHRLLLLNSTASASHQLDPPFFS